MKIRMSAKNRQGGAVAIMVGLTIALLVGFLGLALDLGRLFIVKTELQNAMDACALAAAGGLAAPGGMATAGNFADAESRGMLVGQRNKFDFQGSNVVMLADSDVTFSPALNGTYRPKGSVTPNSRFVKCEVTPGGFVTWFIQALQAWLGVASGPNSVNAFAVATLQPAQIACAIPLGLCVKPGGAAPDYGFEVGKWETSKFPPGGGFTGSFDWIDFTPPGGGASELADLLAGVGQCNLPAADTCVGEQGQKQSLAKAWNTRFGLYQGSYNVSNALPDKTGFSYKPTTTSPSTALTWREFSDTPQNAYSGTPAAGVTAQNYITARGSHTPYQSTNPDTINPLSGITSSQHDTFGGDRRLVSVPIVDCTNFAGGEVGCGSQQAKVKGYACILILHPFDSPSDDIFLEYRGRTNAPGNPCVTAGLGGGSEGPLVPVLVQ